VDVRCDNAAMRRKRIGAIAVAVIAIGGPAAASSPDEAIELPETLSGGLIALDLPDAYPDDMDPAIVEESVANRRTADTFNADGYSEALGGVPAASRLYAPADLAVFYSVVAVRAELTPLVPFSFVDPAALGLAKPTTEFVWEDDVSCVVTWAAVPAGETPTDDDRQAVACQAIGDGLTVRINANSGETSAHVAELALEVVAAIS
jgi:hypothetical protein